MAKPKSVTFEPLEKMARQIADLPDYQPGDRSTDKITFNDNTFAMMVGSSPRTLKRWRSEGKIPWLSADQMAIALGLHPILVWGDEWLALDEDYVRAEISKEMRKLAVADTHVDA
jgi:hypothetical protein